MIAIRDEKYFQDLRGIVSERSPFDEQARAHRRRNT